VCDPHDPQVVDALQRVLECKRHELAVVDDQDLQTHLGVLRLLQPPEQVCITLNGAFIDMNTS
jgi:hypothetical protein